MYVYITIKYQKQCKKNVRILCLHTYSSFGEIFEQGLSLLFYINLHGCNCLAFVSFYHMCMYI